MTDRPKKPRGFATMSPEQRREIASMGGKSVPASSRSFSLDHDLAVKAGRYGGSAVKPEKRSFSTDRDLASRAGSKGALANWSKRRREK